MNPFPVSGVYDMREGFCINEAFFYSFSCIIRSRSGLSPHVSLRRTKQGLWQSVEVGFVPDVRQNHRSMIIPDSSIPYYIIATVIGKTPSPAWFTERRLAESMTNNTRHFPSRGREGRNTNQKHSGRQRYFYPSLLLSFSCTQVREFHHPINYISSTSSSS